MSRYDQVSFKQSHNSYDRDEDSHESLRYLTADPSNAGCRGLEYDIFRRSDPSGSRSIGFFQVGHDSPDKGPLASYLGYLLSWHLANPNHDVIFVTLDIKSTEGDKTTLPGEFDAYLREWFSEELLFTPGALSPRNPNFVAYVRTHGWPDLHDLRGKFIFCLSGNEAWKVYYAQFNPLLRLCFADRGFSDSTPVTVPANGQRIIFSSNLSNDNFTTWKTSVTNLRAANLITRGYLLNEQEIWDRAKEAKLNLLVTDRITQHPWAHVGSTPFVEL